MKSRINPHIICPHCKSLPKECTCQQIDIQPNNISKIAINAVARSMIRVMSQVIDRKTGKFKNPLIEAEYKQWYLERYGLG